MFIYASYPLVWPGTDSVVHDVELRIYASGDDKDFWDVQFLSTDDRWHTVPDDQRRTVLAHLEKNDPLTWGDIRAEADVNPTLAA